MTWFAVGAAVVGTGASLFSSNKAAKGQEAAAGTALGEQRRQYDTTRADNQTALDARNYGINQMQSLADSYKAGPSAADVLASPGYQFGLQQGQKGLNSNAAATGGLYSGNQLRAASRYNTDYATTKYDDQLNNLRNAQNDQFNRYASLSGQGQLGANAINSAGQNFANQSGTIAQNNANAQGAAGIAQANVIGNFANQTGSGLSNWFANRPATQQSPYAAGGAAGAGFGSGAAWGNQDLGGNFADGGPVVREPQVGSTSPLPSGGGGNLSSKAILDAIIRRQAAKVLRDGISQLPANPVTHPRSVLDDQERQAGTFAHGGAVHGPGGPRQDLIPAHLSNGEHVIDAASVNALGDGDNALGQQRLNMLRAKLHGAH